MKLFGALLLAFWACAAQAQTWEYRSAVDMNLPAGSDVAIVSVDRSTGPQGRYTFGVGMDLDAGRWYMTFAVPMPQKRSFSIRVVRNSEVATRTYALDDIYHQAGQSPGKAFVSVWVNENALEALMSGDTITMTVGAAEYRFPLTGSRRQISRLIATLEPIWSARENDKAQTLAQAISDCDRMTANVWDASRQARGVSWSKIEAAPAIKACRHAFENTEYPTRVRMQYQLGRALDKAGRKEALKMLFVSGENYGYPAALHHLAVLYQDGTYSEVDDFLAEKFYRAAAKKGHIPSMHELAEVLLKSPRSLETTEQAHGWLRKAMDGKYYRSYATLGEEVMFGRVAGVEASAAVDVLLPASEAGNAKASMALANLYRNGLGTTPNPDRYLKYLKRAAQQGHAGAKEQLGLE